MISEKLQNAINEQITAEMWSANLYLAMSFYFEKEGFSGFAHWMKNNPRKKWDMLMQWQIISSNVEELLKWIK